MHTPTGPLTRSRTFLATMAIVVALGSSASPARAAGIVTHAWMGLEGIDRVETSALHSLLDAHRDQVRAGAEFPDGGYWTRDVGTPGGDYGEEAHWQRFIDAYAAQIRDDPSCAPLTDPAGPCAATIAHLMGAAAHGMGDEVWDWLFEPNGPGFGESYLPSDFGSFVGPGGLEVVMDIVAIARHARPIGATPPIPDLPKIAAAFVAIGRTDIDPAACTTGDQYLDVERGAETIWASSHIDALERAMPWTSAHLITSAGGIDFAARAIAGYYETIWGTLLGAVPATRVSVTAPADGQLDVPATGWAGSYSPGSNPGNHGGITRIAAALSSAMPYHALAGQGSQPNELPADALRLRDVETGELVAPKSGYPRIVPYGSEAGEHVVAFQPAGDLEPCRWYQVETTTTLVDARLQPVTPSTWQFRTSGCARGDAPRPVHGSVVCDATGSVTFRRGLTTAGTSTKRARGGIHVDLASCAGGQSGAQRPGASLPIARGVVELDVALATSSCSELTRPSAPAHVRGRVQWLDAQGKAVGISTVNDDVDVRGGVITVRSRARVFPLHALALRIAPDAAGCGAGGATMLPITGGKVTVWEE